MIHTVFVTGNSATEQWQAELLEHSWHQAGQPGELVRLLACPPGTSPPHHNLARVVTTSSWHNHPYLADHYAGYNLPGALLEWLLKERVDATILLLDVDSILLESINEEVAPGGAMGNAWKDMPQGDGPFGLPLEYIDLQAYCVNRALTLPQIEFPVLIHSSDLRKLAARWLELTGIIRHSVRFGAKPPCDAVKVGYAIAASEYRIQHASRKLANTGSDRKAVCPVLTYQQPIESAQGHPIFDARTHALGSTVSSVKPAHGAGREFISRLRRFESERESGEYLKYLRPVRRPGVREARVMDQMLLDIRVPPGALTLNPSAAAVWQLCNGQNTLGDIAQVLSKKFNVPTTTMNIDIASAAAMLRGDGAIDLERVYQ
jgi:hypothetical protein